MSFTTPLAGMAEPSGHAELPSARYISQLKQQLRNVTNDARAVLAAPPSTPDLHARLGTILTTLDSVHSQGVGSLPSLQVRTLTSNNIITTPTTAVT